MSDHEESSAVTCPGCGAQADGAFCSQCGTAVGTRFCNTCGQKTKPGDAFCTGCGARIGGAVEGAGAGPQPTGVGASTGASAGRAPGAGASRPAGGAAGQRQPPAAAPAGSGGQSWLVWVIVALLLGGGAAVIGFSTRPGAGTPAAGAPGGALGASAVDLASMTPREAADRLFNRVVSAAERGDSTEMTQFLPMSISAYDVAEPLDDDGLFHKTILQRLAGDMQGALASAETVLERSPGHLLVLASAAEASSEGGDVERARAYYQRFLDAYDEEMAKDVEEYAAHGALIPGMRSDAEALLGSGS